MPPRRLFAIALEARDLSEWVAFRRDLSYALATAEAA